ncbi:MAG TPA: hypothetical protein VMR25_15050 [Planctomycetaceae bacterium]|nr:hypothetical protein [Planctomycetaceae bacterium]
MKDDGSVDVMEPKNITRFAILDPALQSSAPKLRVAGQVVPLPVLDAGSGPRQSVIGKRDGGWAYLGELGTVKLVGKRPGLQGPIDDAFATRFLCVRGTGQAWNPAVQAWADASLKRFAGEWDRYFRGELPIKNDSDVTAEDVRSSNLILFGDPGSNRWIAQVLPGLPLVWTKQELVFGGANYSAADHAVLLIHPNPLASDRYVVLNSGHTFGEQELASLNYLLFPRLGDWAVLNVPSRELVHAGFFDEQWRVAGRPAR